MKELITKVEKILDQYFGDNVNNRINQWSFRTLKQVVLGEIANYKIDGKPIEPTKEKIIRK
jgi:hypothetical protein